MPTENTPKTLADLQRHPVLRHFLKISSIPRRSFYEKEIGEYLLDWARELGLSARMDDLYNVYVRKPASPGQEGKKPVILQAHTDMVCEKAPGVAHDFATDPLHLELNGDILSTGGRTTLGADDGMGCALAMAIVENDDIVHPPLEVLFTTAEEDDMRGAAGVDASFLTGEYLINLDNMQEDRPVAGSAGGTGVHITVPTEVVPIPAQTMPCRLAVAGLPGGHSGGDIAKGHGNAILLLARLLEALQQTIPVCAADVRGGQFRLAIPREAEASLYLPASRWEEAKQQVAACAEEFAKEYGAVATQLTVTLEEAPACEEASAVLSPDCLAKLVRLLLLLPNGVHEMLGALPGVVESSDNIGELRLLPKEQAAEIVIEIRATHPSSQHVLQRQIQRLVQEAGGTVDFFAGYPSWPYRPDSRLGALYPALYEKEFGSPATVCAVHGGLEIGHFLSKRPDLDALAIGANGGAVHSPQEWVSVSSVERMYHMLQVLLRKLCEEHAEGSVG